MDLWYRRERIQFVDSGFQVLTSTNLDPNVSATWRNPSEDRPGLMRQALGKRRTELADGDDLAAEGRGQRPAAHAP